MDDVANAAGMTKQGLYVHFSGKHKLLEEALHYYLQGSLLRVEAALSRTGASLHDRLVSALDEWFGTHIVMFDSAAYDIIEIGRLAPDPEIERLKQQLRDKLAAAIAISQRRSREGNVCTPKELAALLFAFGLTWKDYAPDRAAFRKMLSLCVRASCQIERDR